MIVIFWKISSCPGEIRKLTPPPTYPEPTAPHRLTHVRSLVTSSIDPTLLSSSPSTGPTQNNLNVDYSTNIPRCNQFFNTFCSDVILYCTFPGTNFYIINVFNDIWCNTTTSIVTCLNSWPNTIKKFSFSFSKLFIASKQICNGSETLVQTT